MDSALKQRLVGAAVLVALAVIFLPMLLDRPAPESGAGEVSMDMPAAPEREMETRELPLTPPPATTAPTIPPAPALEDPNRVTTVDADVLDRVDARPEDDAVPATTPGGAPLPRDVASDAAAARQPPVPPPAPATGAGFAVQIGTFGNLDNATALQRKVEAAGLPVTTESVSVAGKPGLRLRAGPFADRGSAERARLAITRVEAGLEPEVVALDAEAATPAPAAVRAGFAVQVAALRSGPDAQALRERLRAGGVSAFIDEVPVEGGRVYRVRAGPVAQRAAAESLQADLRQKFQLDGIVVAHP
ncbi:MAG TPA: SPOR domain-containing protein [Xanthomonadaceae bacterium]|nr:SPOR domain-containing protein [Xanthomonadaceae bacterium]